MNAEQLLRALGATGRLKGFRYAAYMIGRVEQDPLAGSLITKGLYPETARRYGVLPGAVEHNLRTLVKKCWEQPDRGLLEEVAGGPLRRRPTNGEFLDMAAAYLRQTED